MQNIHDCIHPTVNISGNQHLLL